MYIYNFDCQESAVKIFQVKFCMASRYLLKREFLVAKPSIHKLNLNFSLYGELIPHDTIMWVD